MIEESFNRTAFSKRRYDDFKLMEDQIKLIFEQRCHGMATLGLKSYKFNSVF